ncbi:MAG TPA: Gfo/Idh/MocA family oxidoreductase [Phycisphaerae bacterium]|nr:Gfo/Idh/MocA family oxidoreductase [Phycisphaerae bacterium]
MAKKNSINVALIGRGFMGRTHSNAWGQVNRFCNPPIKAVLHTACDNVADGAEDYCQTWGWQKFEQDFSKVCKDSKVDLVDLGTPNYIHASMAIEALQAGKHVACEKPLAGTLEDASKMVNAARKSKAKTFVWYSYRRCPAIAFAHQLVKAGKLGDIRHVRAFYLQSWADESVPLAWRFDKKLAGSGAHGDLNAHIVDMTRFVTGQEITEISGAIAETFIKKRNKMVGNVAGGIAAGLQKSQSMGNVTVDDTVLFLARFSGGAVASFEAARQATGNLNRNGFEINGTKGSLMFNFERMAELQYFDATADEGLRGWTTINCTHGGSHPFVDMWWPDAHAIGYEHTFTNMASDILRVLAGQKPIVPLADFEDAYQTQRVLEAVMLSATKKRPVKLKEILN